MSTQRRGDRGSVTAEFAVALPTLLIVLVLVVGVLTASARQIRLEHGAAQAARLASRGEPDGRSAAAIAAALPGAGMTIHAGDDLVCVTATAPTGLPLPLPALSARSCAVAEAR